MTQLSRAAGVAISASFPAYAKVDGSQSRKSRVSEERASETERDRESEAHLPMVREVRERASLPVPDIYL